MLMWFTCISWSKWVNREEWYFYNGSIYREREEYYLEKNIDIKMRIYIGSMKKNIDMKISI